MARPDVEPFAAGRLGLVIPMREFPIWLSCAFWPFAVAILGEAARRQVITAPDWILEPAKGLALAIFDWCWMTALCRSTTRQLLTFPAARGFWLFLILQIGFAIAGWLFTTFIGLAGLAAFSGRVLFLDWSGIGIQLVGFLLVLLVFPLCAWVGLRLTTWPAHCVATGTLVGPQIIWRAMRNHSYNMLIISIITLGPLLLLFGAELAVLHASGAPMSVVRALKAVTIVAAIYLRGAFDAATLIAYFEIFAGTRAENPAR